MTLSSKYCSRIENNYQENPYPRKWLNPARETSAARRMIRGLLLKIISTLMAAIRTLVTFSLKETTSRQDPLNAKCDVALPSGYRPDTMITKWNFNPSLIAFNFILILLCLRPLSASSKGVEMVVNASVCDASHRLNKHFVRDARSCSMTPPDKIKMFHARVYDPIQPCVSIQAVKCFLLIERYSSDA